MVRSERRLPALALFGAGILGLFLWTNSLVLGQGFSSTISGVVRDASGAVIPDAMVTARNTETGLTRTTETGVNGGYNLPSLPVGPYELTVEKPGFRQLVRGGLTLAVGQEAVLNLTLEVGQVTQTVEVTGEAPIVNTTTSSTTGLITEGQIKDLPLNGRSFEQLLTLNTGTVNNNTNSGGSSFSVAGKRTETNRFTMNGVDYVGNNQTGQYIAPQGASQYLLGVDAVREYNVLGTTYGAEYGKRAGGQISVVTMSGTNQLHGTVFEYLRNNKFDARNYFSYEDQDGDGKADAPPFKRNQFGGSLGGPIRRDKMFLFGNYEGFRERLAVDNVAVVPSLGARSGSLPCNVVHTSAAARAANCPDLNAYIPVPNLQRGMLPFLEHYWPAPNGEEVVSSLGLASGSAYHRSNPSRAVQEDFGLARFDYNLSASDSFMSNFTVSRGHRVESTGSAGQAANTNFFANPQQELYTLGLQETHIFSPTVLNVAMFGYSHARGQNQTRPRTDDFPENLVLMRGGDRNNPGAFNFSGGATANVLAPIIPANGSNLHFNQRRYFTVANDLRMTRGRHNLSMGVWAQRVHQWAFSSGQNNAGTAAYAGLLNFLQDNLNQFVVAVNPQLMNFNSTEAAWYFQDEIKLRPNLTVRLGLRDEMTTGWNENNGRSSNYLFDPSGVIQTHPYVGRSPFVENHAVALWQPRVGVAWDPTGTGTWAVRAGFGIHNDLQDNLAHRLNANPPFNARLQIRGQPLLSIIPIAGSTPPPPTCERLDEQGRNAPAGCAIFAPGGLDPVMHTPTIQQWSLEVERAITQDLAVQVGYVGSQSYHVSTSVDMNTIQPLRCENPSGCRAGGTLSAGNGGGTFVPQGTEFIPWGNNGPNTQPNRFVGSTQGWYYFGTSAYHSLNLSLTKRSRGGLMFKTNYTWSKVTDISSAILGNSAENDTVILLNRFNPKLSHGIASYSLLHQFNTNVSYQLPFGSGRAIGGGATGWVDKVIGGWQWNTIFAAQSGFPITPLVGASRLGDGNSRPADVPLLNPNFNGKVIRGVDGFKKARRYFDPEAFLLPAPGTYGNAGRGSFRGPGLFNMDMSLFKRIPINERWNLQFRAEAFNILNHANFDMPNTVVFEGANYSSTAGEFVETSTRERQIQFALRLEF